MNIFISNDDGIESEGLKSLCKCLSKDNNLLVIAPDGNRSACSHMLSINKTITVKKYSESNFITYAISGSPADCVKISKLIFPEFKTDIIVAGINKGHNIGSDIMYSGTMAIACEGAFFGHVSFAFSAFNHEQIYFDDYSELAKQIIDLLLPFSESGDIWNINFPNEKRDKINGIKITPLGKHLYSDRYVKVNEDEYQLIGEPLKNNDEELDCDVNWINKGYVTITPILFNKTNYSKLSKIKLCKQL